MWKILDKIWNKYSMYLDNHGNYQHYVFLNILNINQLDINQSKVTDRYLYLFWEIYNYLFVGIHI